MSSNFYSLANLFAGFVAPRPVSLLLWMMHAMTQATGKVSFVCQVVVALDFCYAASQTAALSQPSRLALSSWAWPCVVTVSG